MQRILKATFALIVTWLITSADLCGRGIAEEKKTERTASDDIFGHQKVHQLHLTVTSEDYAAMEPTQGGFPFGPPPGGGAGRPGGPPGAGRPGGGPPPGPGGFGNPFGGDAGAGRFNFDFKYVHADLVADGTPFKNVGLRYKGNGSYMMSARGAKRSFKIDLDRFDDKQSFRGHRKLNLNSGAMDPTKAREALAYSVFRAAGVPSPRTAFAEVRLTVPGKFDAENLGVYTLVEQVDKAFLKENFGSAKGLLLKPEGIRGVPYFGDDKAAYEKPYNAKAVGDDHDWQKLIEFTRLVNKDDDETFRAKVGEYLDLDRFSRFLAANTMLATFDSFIGLGHNYYLYLDPKTKRFVFFPWDLDLAFGSFPMFGTADQQMDLSIDHPHVGDNKLIDRLLAMPDVKEMYRQQLRRIVDSVFQSDSLGREIETVEAVTRDLIARDKASADARKEGGGFGFGPPGGGNPFGSAPVALKTFMEKRAASVSAQLAGKSRGYVPAMGFGPGGPQPPQPGKMLSRPLLTMADADKDGKVSKAEAQAAFEASFSKWDRNADGTLDEGELEQGINALLSAPPQFGPPAGAPPRGRPEGKP